MMTMTRADTGAMNITTTLDATKTSGSITRATSA
jgi:hypothetical protein